MIPIKVRGKRIALQAEKWNFGKRRKTTTRDDSSGLSVRSSDDASVSLRKTAFRPRERKASKIGLTRLEELPTEILQAIFVKAGNLDLALASPSLAAQLSSTHVHHELTYKVLSPVLGCPENSGKRPAPCEVLAARRLLNAKFITWNFFKDWVQDCVRRQGVQRPKAAEDGMRQLWRGLEPSATLLPPRKLLAGPWTADKVAFLEVIAPPTHSIAEIDPVSAEIARQGLEQAITQGCEPAVNVFMRIGLKPNTDILQHAVIDSGCNQNIVLQLLHAAEGQMGSHSKSLQDNTSGAIAEIEPLDPALWRWADKARARGDGKGTWLMRALKECASLQERSKQSQIK